jgi:hypothetical protein
MAAGAGFAPSVSSPSRLRPRPAPVLRSATQLEPPGEARPALALVDLVLRKIPSYRPALDACLAAQGLKQGDYPALFRSVRIAASPKTDLYFIRPPVAPYCQALYGTHLFRYFLLSGRVEGRAPRFDVVFEGAGDRLEIEPQVTSGLNDIVTTDCNAAFCWVARWTFDGASYNRTRCFKDWGRTRTDVRCSDGADLPRRSRGR